MRLDQSQAAQSAWDAVERFIAGTDPQATTTLYTILHDSAEEPCVHVLSLPAPQLLQHALQAPAEGASARLLVVALLNHLFCTRLLPLTLQRPADRKATGLDELEELYCGVLQSTALSPAVERQLVPCAATLLLLNHPSALLMARNRFLGHVDENGLPITAVSATQRQRYVAIFLALCDLLTDRRVPLGPVQRARQLRDLQQSLDMMLSVTFTTTSPTATQNADGNEHFLVQNLVRAVGRGAALLLERASDEPLDLCPSFWSRLPSHPLWEICLAGACDDDGESVESVGQILRCLTVMEPASEQLLTSALTVALQMGPTRSSYELMTAALEASTEAVILNYDPNHPLFQLLSRSAERLISPLQMQPNESNGHSEDNADECDLLACEGIAVLAQTLTSFPIPEMEPTDDPEDYEAIVEEMQSSNANKARVLAVMRDFFVLAQRCLFHRLATRLSATDYEALARYLSQCLNDDDDTCVSFDQPCVAYYSTYERLYALLGALPAEAVSATQDCSAPLACVSADARATLWFWQHRLAQALQPPDSRSPSTSVACSTPLIPVLARRFTTPHTCFAATSTWSDEEVGTAVGLLASHIRLACQGSCTAPTRYLMDTVAVLLDETAPHRAAMQLPQHVCPLVWGWLSSVSGVASTFDAVAKRHCNVVARHLGNWLHRGLFTPSSLETFVGEAVTMAPPFQLEVLSALPASSVNDVAGVMALCPLALQWTGDAPQDSELQKLGQRLAGSVQRLLVGDGSNGQLLTELLQQRAATSPVLCPALLTIITQCHALPSRPELALNTASNAIWSLGSPSDVATSDLEWILGERVCSLLVQASPIDTVHALIESLLQPSPSYTTTTGMHRLHLVARFGRMLVESGRSVLQVLLWCYTAALQRVVECVSAVSLVGFSSKQASPAPSLTSTRRTGCNVDDGDNENTIVTAALEEMAAFGRCATAPLEGSNAGNCPEPIVACVARLAQCDDDFERLAILKDMIQ